MTAITSVIATGRVATNLTFMQIPAEGREGHAYSCFENGSNRGWR